MPILRPPAIALTDTAVQHSETPFKLETARRTVIKLAHPLNHQLPLPPVSESTLAAMQRLVEIIDTLRSSQPSFLEGLALRSPGILQILLPYVTEEAYDVLDTLQNDESVSLPSPPHPLLPSPSYPYTTIEALIPSLLWQIARSDYSVMHLIEGVRGKCWQQVWATGMLRLVVMLELEAPTVRWCFDLATGLPVEELLESTAIVQADEPLPVQSAHAGAATDANDPLCQVEHQLQAILRLLHETFGLRDFLQGIAIELLQPCSDWQAGKLQLRFGFEFSAFEGRKVPDGDRSVEPESIAAALMADRVGVADGVGIADSVGLADGVGSENSVGIESSQLSQRLTTPLNATTADAIATTQVGAMSTPRSLRPTSLIRASNAASLEGYVQQTIRQQLRQRCQLHQHNQDETQQLESIVQTALIALACKTSTIGELQQPMLLLDELAPKLLWSLTSCSYEMMQLLGGLSAQVLQPRTNWQQGTLRLLAVLQITATGLDYTLDLSTGRSVPKQKALEKGAIIQSSASTLCQQPTSIETLTAHLQQLCDSAPAYRLLVDRFAVDWLEDVEQDWQSGLMTLKLSLVFAAAP